MSLAYLWRRDQGELLQEMIDSNIDAIIIKVAALGLDPSKHLGLKISEIQQHLVIMVTFNSFLIFDFYITFSFYEFHLN